MNISELIDQLDTIRAKHGNLLTAVVSADFSAGGDTYAPLDDLFIHNEERILTLGATSKMCGDRAVPQEIDQ